MGHNIYYICNLPFLVTLISYGFEHSMFFLERIQETEASVSDVIDNLNSITPEELESKLSKLYASLQTRKRKEYSKFALAGLRAGINRFFRQPPKNRLFSNEKLVRYSFFVFRYSKKEVSSIFVFRFSIFKK